MGETAECCLLASLQGNADATWREYERWQEKLREACRGYLSPEAFVYLRENRDAAHEVALYHLRLQAEAETRHSLSGDR